MFLNGPDFQVVNFDFSLLGAGDTHPPTSGLGRFSEFRVVSVKKWSICNLHYKFSALAFCRDGIPVISAQSEVLSFCYFPNFMVGEERRRIFSETDTTDVMIEFNEGGH